MFFNQPLDQFDIYLLENSFSHNTINSLFFRELYNLNFIFKLSNNSTFLLLIFIIVFIIISFILIKRFKLLYSSFWQYFFEEFIFKFPLLIVLSQVGKIGQKYVIYISTLFYFILLSNVIGLIPGSFTITSHIILTFMFGSTTILGLTIIGFLKQKLKFLNLFIPRGVPKILLPLLVTIEIVSYIARGFSLSIRLFANLMSGHSLIHILIGFSLKLLKVSNIVFLFALSLIIAIFILEIGISFLQAYVFAILVSIYLKDSYEVSH